MELSQLPKLKGKRRPAKRVGRGWSSGRGHMATRGQKGQKARGKVKLGFEGGQLPLHKRLPHQRGFKRAFRNEVVILNLEDLNRWNPKTAVSPQTLLEAGLIERIPKGGVKILGDGELKKKLAFKGVELSETAKEKILKAEGRIEDAR